MGVFIGLVEISGRYRALKHGFDLLGVPCTLAAIDFNRFEYGGNSDRFLIRFVTNCMKRDQRIKKKWGYYGIAFRIFWRVLALLLKVPLFIWALRNYDLFIFGYGS